jgi:hypothetical protein
MALVRAVQKHTAKHPPKSFEEKPRPSGLVVKAGAASSPVRPDYLDFAKKLREAMVERQLSASDLAREIWGTTTDPRGYQVAKNRDRIGAYLAGTGFPSKETMPKLCAALGLAIDELPKATRSSAAREMATGPADLTFSLLPDHPEICSLFIRRLLPVKIGLQIVELVNQAGRIDDDPST